ncbi:MAG: glucose 1-dehydrogenase [Gemmatales bacterium]|nr:glucose 1-dehydrogenase [Gemmatales bacterium]
MAILERFRLDGKRAVITGGSRGLGRAIAQALAEAGADLVLVARDADTLAQAQTQLLTTGRRVDVVVGDLSTPEGTETVCQTILERFAPIDILVNNVGGRRINVPTEDLALADWQRILDLNLTSAFLCSRELGRHMVQRRQGSIINIASIAGLIVFRGIAGRTYEVAKAALIHLTRTLAADWAPFGVRVNAIAPGAFLTDANRRWFQEMPQLRTKVESQIPLGRLGNPEEIGPAAVFLASDASSYMTGAVLVLDGGHTLW